MTVTDASGNTAVCTSTVTVEDNVAPQMVCQAYTYTLVNGMVTIDPADFVNATDNCSAVSLRWASTQCACT